MDKNAEGLMQSFGVVAGGLQSINSESEGAADGLQSVRCRRTRGEFAVDRCPAEYPQDCEYAGEAKAGGWIKDKDTETGCFDEWADEN